MSRIALFALASALAASACATSDEPAPTPSSDPAERFVTEIGHSYSFVWQRSCKCTAETTRAIRIDVIRDEIAAATYVDTDQPVADLVYADLMTVSQIFVSIHDAVDDGAAVVHVEYDDALGFPRSVVVDYSAQLADEELVLALSSVTPIGGPGCGGAPDQ